MATKKEVFDYVMNSPENTNPSVLKSVLDDLKEKVVVKCVAEDGRVKLQDRTFEALFFDQVRENLKKGTITELEVYDNGQYWFSLVANLYYVYEETGYNVYGIVFLGARLPVGGNKPRISYLDWSQKITPPSSFDVSLRTFIS